MGYKCCCGIVVSGRTGEEFQLQWELGIIALVLELWYGVKLLGALIRWDTWAKDMLLEWGWGSWGLD